MIRVKTVLLRLATDEFREEVEGFDYWDGVTAVGGFEISVTNTTDEKATVHPAQATVIVRDEQVDTNLWFSDDVGGEVFPGVKKEGAVIFGIERLKKWPACCTSSVRRMTKTS